jgi:hypothetical protein
MSQGYSDEHPIAAERRKGLYRARAADTGHPVLARSAAALVAAMQDHDAWMSSAARREAQP